MKKMNDFLQSKTLNQRNLRDRYQQIAQKVLNDQDVKSFIQKNGLKITDTFLDKNLSKLYEYVNQRDKQSKIIPGYKPKLIISDHDIEVVYEPSEDTLVKQKAAMLRKRVEMISMPKTLRKASISDYELKDVDGRSEALVEALSFIDEYSKTPENFHKGLYLYGNFGVGKTYLCGAIANELAGLNHKSLLLHFPSFAIEMKGLIGKDTLLETLNRVKQVEILMIDDIGASSLSSWVRDEILGVILEYRMQNELTTFFTSNFSMDLLEKQHLALDNRGESNNEVKAARLMQRIKYLSKPVMITGDNLRLNND